ncbi:hypothetical protein ACFV30_41855 [Streptomyces sp. NPDC059752]|uniref:hypothetical protein n=1 Tax=unclassified Streptomyces TaxID=2593676 RepID=UPI003664735B
MTTERTEPRNLTDIHAALGRMVYQAASLESVIRFTGEMLAKNEQEAKDLAGKTAGTLFPAVATIVARRPGITPEERGQFAAIVADAKPHLTSRNTYIHGGWGEPDGVLVAMNRRRNDFRMRPLSVADLDTLSAAFLALVNRVFEWLVPVMERTHMGTASTE